MDRMFIISQKHQAKNDVISAGVLLANQLGVSPEVMSYCYESFSGDAYYNPRIAASVRLQILNEAEKNVETELTQLGAEQVPHHAVWCKNLSEHACGQVNADEYAMMLKSLAEPEHLQPTDWQLIRNTQVPLMLMNNNLVRRANSILMAVDLGSNNPDKLALNHAVIKQAKQLAKATGAKLHLGFVIRLPKLLRDMDVVNTQHLVKEAYLSHKQEIELIGLPPEQVHILIGDADLCLFELSCRLKAEYIVMGVRQHKGILGQIIGNTAEAILQRLRSNILVVPNVKLSDNPQLSSLI
ncbi:universal stress protein [Shewanella fidelis]|uniref:Universal stress protein n=1 Tax=Shewanella fidelis TaxID=173509 RepID=A0AAW8NHR6_9GAMM|nr:universal stress protein [Shewanella fidelis]MDR8522250.1 universal stress protein [Shewanella fidelis]MDW4812534.1 universal stress protein [Shewanella fidelis]MDW4816281.1 universal stress protein [Shewanella fidelis]MDW4820775.1 universal stress protein [Shewanella fidelis]MDW4824997.1 universal stress protein [Shewanella fidelis]